MIPEPRKKFESSFSHENTHLMTFKYGRGDMCKRKLEGLACKVDSLIMDKKYDETGNNAYLRLKYDTELLLAVRLFCWNGMTERKPIAKIVDELSSLGVKPKLSVDNYEILQYCKKTRNPLKKYLSKRFSGVGHCEGYYKIIELERKYGSEVVRDVFEGRFDSDFKGKS